MNYTVRTPYAEKIVLWLLVIGAAFVRFYHLGSMSLSNDELSSLVRIRFDSFSEMIANGVYVDGHPAGLQTFLFYWVKFFGDDVFILRFPFALCGVLSVYMIYKIGKRWFNETTAFLAATVFAFSSFTILFTQLARMYSPAILFSLLTVYYWTHFLFTSPDKRKRKSDLAGWIVFTAIALHLHYFSFFFVAIVGLSGLFFVKRADAVKYISGGIIALLLFLPEAGIFRTQITRGSIGGWLPAPSDYFLLQYFFELFNRSFLICILSAAILITGIIFSKKVNNYNRWRILSVSWFLLSFAIAFLYSVFSQPIIMYSTLLFVTPFILLFVFSFIPPILFKKKNAVIVATIFMFLFFYDTVVTGKYFSVKHFGVFREVAEAANDWKNKYGKDNVKMVANVINSDYLDYYFKRMENPPEAEVYHIETPAEFSDLFRTVKNSSTEYFIYIWTNGSHPLEVPEIIRNSYPHLVEKRSYFNAEAYLFSKHSVPGELKDIIFSSVYDYEYSDWNFDTSRASSEMYLSPVHSEKMTSEFSAGLKWKLADISRVGYRYATYTAWIYPMVELEKATMIFSFDRNGQPYSYFSVSLSDFKLKLKKWQPVILTAPMPSEIENDDVFSAYIWNPSRKLFYIDDMKVDVYSGNDPYLIPIH